jgi:alpha-L-fucosidase
MIRPQRGPSALFLLASLLPSTAPAAARPTASRETPQQKWFRDAAFGMFIHWGPFSVLGEGEWVMNNRGMLVSEYERLPPQFNPTEYDPIEWVAVAKSAGMRYITVISKLHDGFAMLATKQSDWNIVDRTAYKKDPLKALADECRRQGIKLFFDYSQLDWHHPDYYPLGETGRTAGRAPGGDWYRYLDFMDAQLTELLTNYGQSPESGWTACGTSICRLALGEDLPAHPSPPTGDTDRQQPPH